MLTKHEKARHLTRTPIRTIVVIVLLLFYVLCLSAEVLAAASGIVDLGPIKVTPSRLSQGQHPNIETRVGQAPRGIGTHVVVNVIAIVTRPDHRSWSRNWKMVKVSKDTARTITVPKEYDTSVAGTYRVEILVYSSDMKHRFARRSNTFDVVGQQQKETLGNKMPSGAKKGTSIETAGQERKRSYLGLGLYGNALNPAGGGMLLAWPSKYVGLEGIYSTGEFTSYEGRLIVKIDWSQVYGFYGGVGYIHVMTEKDVIGIATRFSDSGMSGVVGVEAALGKKVLLYVEASTARIELEKIVTSGAQTVKASVKYAPVTIGIGLVIMVF